jgi:hypothetical protein
MSDLPLRFLHAADFQLDEPVTGLTEIPDHLRESLIDGTYQAARRVFDTAISEHVAFVCLCGDVIDLGHPTARSLAFLSEQFQRMESEGIAVYWSVLRGSATNSWPTSIPLPDNIHRFADVSVESLTHEDASGFVVKVLGRSGTGEIPAAEFSAPASGQYSVAVVSGHAEGHALAKRNVDYWALGGSHDRKTLFAQPTLAHYCGTPQGRSPQDIGPHGCTLVEVRRPRETRLRFIPCDMVRCQHERVMVSAAASWNDLQELLSQRVGEMRSQTPTIPLLVRWTLAAADNSVDAAALSTLAAKSLTWLKKQYGYHSEPCWPVSVRTDVQRHISASEYEEDTLLGDYLRAVRAVREEQQVSIAQSPCVPDQLPGDLQWLADLSDAATCNGVLREATGLGAALLRGEKAI